MVHVYVLYSESHDRFYRGITADISRRLSEHNAGRTASTRPYRPWKLIYQEVTADHTNARERERYLQSAAGRRFLRKILADLD